MFFKHWTQIAQLTQPDVLKASWFPLPFLAITRIIDFILLDVRKRPPKFGQLWMVMKN